MAERLALNLGSDPEQHENFRAQTEWLGRDHGGLEFVMAETRAGELMLLLPEGTEAAEQFYVGRGVARGLSLPDGGRMSCDDEMLEVVS